MYFLLWPMANVEKKLALLFRYYTYRSSLACLIPGAALGFYPCFPPFLFVSGSKFVLLLCKVDCAIGAYVIVMVGITASSCFFALSKMFSEFQ